MVFIPSSSCLASLSYDVLSALTWPEIGLTTHSPIAPTHLAHAGGTCVCYQSHLWNLTRWRRFLVGLSSNKTLLVECRNDHYSCFLLAHSRFSPFALIGFAALIHLLLRIFGVPISLDLYALHDARCITSRLTRPIGLKLECPHTPIRALQSNFLSVIFRTTRSPSRLTFDGTVFCLLVSTAKTIVYRRRLVSNYPPPLSKQWFS
jgi:hypothetical protein